MFDYREKTALVFYPDNQTDTPVTQSNDCVRRNETGEGRRKYVTGYRQEEKQVQGDRDGWGKRIQQRVSRAAKYARARPPRKHHKVISK